MIVRTSSWEDAVLDALRAPTFRRRRGPQERASRAKDAHLARRDEQRALSVLLRKRRTWKRLAGASPDDEAESNRATEAATAILRERDDWEHVAAIPPDAVEGATYYRRLTDWLLSWLPGRGRRCAGRRHTTSGVPQST